MSVTLWAGGATSHPQSNSLGDKRCQLSGSAAVYFEIFTATTV